MKKTAIVKSFPRILLFNITSGTGSLYTGSPKKKAKKLPNDCDLDGDGILIVTMIISATPPMNEKAPMLVNTLAVRTTDLTLLQFWKSLATHTCQVVARSDFTVPATQTR